MAKSRRSGLVSGITLIVVGLLLFWLDEAGFGPYLARLRAESGKES